jgi:hypothetical protein
MAAIAVAALLLLALGCATNERVAFVNPTATTLYVTINEREPFEVPPGESVKATLPALQQLTPITITAHDASGATVFFQSTSVARLVEAGRRIELDPERTQPARPPL